MRACNRMKCLGLLGCFSRLILGFVLSVVMAFSADAQIQQAWVARYNNGITNGTNQAVKMALDNMGNIYVTGSSQNTNNNLGYVTIKYAPNGTQLWAARYDSTNYPTAIPSGLGLDSSNNAIVTGSAVTIKYDTNGNQLWTAPYNGNGVAIDSSGNSIVTGFGSGFNTVKINPTGTNVWLTAFDDPLGPASSQAVVVDGNGNAYVAGQDTDNCYYNGNIEVCYVGLLTVKYDSNGNQLWKNDVFMGGSHTVVQVAGLTVVTQSNVNVVVNGYRAPWSAYSYTTDGTTDWQSGPLFNMLANGFVLDSSGRVTICGDAVPSPGNYPNTSYATVKYETNGAPLWTNYYPLAPAGFGAATSVGIDSANNIYVTGYSPGTNSGNDIVTIKYDPNGNQVWLQRYNGPGNGNDAGNAIAVEKNGNVYVTGYETLAGGGTGIVTIKYIPVSLQRRSDGTVLLEVQGSPGESFDIQASADLRTWLDLGTVLADTNGLMQFDDTNAPNFPARFYVPKPQ
jgi:hypothetical protein